MLLMITNYECQNNKNDARFIIKIMIQFSYISIKRKNYLKKLSIY